MARKSALVVDDSTSARMILSRMLEKYDIEVDMAESAEQAIEYLNSNRPDAIFMDHLMPGMDGLQAVQTIKSNPQTATIPIMMYTSQEGELYVGQARALGAMGVLPKQVRPVDVSKVLYELHLLPDRRDMAEPALLPVELDGSGSIGPAGAAAGNAGGKPPGPDWGRRVEVTVKEQAADLRRFIVASLDGFAARIVNDVREAPPLAAPERPPPIAAPRQPAWPWVTSLLAIGSIAAACAVMLASTREDLTKTRAELAALTSANAELQRSSQELGSTLKDLTAALAASTATLSAATPANGAAAPRVEPVPYGEIPFDRSRLEVLREFLSKLEAQGFRGAVRITSAAGLFCLSGNSTDGYIPAAAALLVSKCDLVGNPFDESLTAQQRQSVDFANLVASIRQRTSGAISVLIENAGSSRAAAPYPQRSESLTAGEWNRAAAFNNRVEFAADPAASP
ncbi:MAG: response regulator [Steroidobacteraceae bacterium]